MKKVCALFLCLIMCMSMLSTVSFADEAAESIFIYEGFEDEETGVIPNGIVYRGASEVFGDTFYTEGATIEIVEDGYIGKCFKATENGGSPFQFGLERVAPTKDEPVYVNFKLKVIEDAGKPNLAVDLGYSGFALLRDEAHNGYLNGPVIFMQGRKGPYYYENNVWYDWTFKFIAGEGTSDARVELVVRDNKGNEFTGFMNDREITNLYPFIKSVYGYKADNEETYAPEGTSILLDEISIVKGANTDAINLLSSNYGEIIDNNTDATDSMNKEVVATEGFDVAEIPNLHAYAGTSAALSAPALWDSYVTHTMVSDCNGGYAPQLTSIDKKQPCISTAPVEIGEDKTFVFMRFKVVDQGTGIVCMTLNPAAPGASNGHDVLIRNGRFDTMSYWGSKNDFSFIPDIWYNFVFEFENVDGTNQATLHVYDDKYEKVLGSAPVSGTKPTNGAGEGVISNALVSVYQHSGVSTWAIDDIKIVKTTEKNTEAFLCNEFGIDYVDKEVIMEEDFNDSTITNLHSYMGATNGNGKFIDVGYWNDSYVYNLQMVDDSKGGYAPQFDVGAGKSPWLNTVGADFTDTGKAFASMRFKVVDDKASANGGVGVPIAKLGFGTADSSDALGYELLVRGGKFETWQYWGRQFVPYEVGKWYTIVYEFQYADGEKTVYLHVYDDQGNEILTGDPAYKTGNLLDPIGNAKLEMTLYRPTAGLEAKVAFDDFMVIKTNEEDTKAFIKSEILGIVPEEVIVDNTVYTTTPVITLGFDALVGDNSVVTFKSAGKNDVAGIVRYTGSSLVEVFPAKALYDDTEYVLDLSGIKGINGQGMDANSAYEISFRTAPHSVGSMTIGEAAIADGKLTLPVTFVNEGAKELNTTFIVALFDGDKLVWSRARNIVGGNMGANVFTFNALPEGADAMELKVFAWGNVGGMQPLYK